MLVVWALPVSAAELQPAIIYPTPLTPEDNPTTPTKVSLGERLFSETRLSSTGNYACTSCHQPERHFTDGRRQAVGALGDLHPFNTPTLYNAGLNSSLGWTDQGLDRLEQQHLIPLLNTNPVEMGFNDKTLATLAADPTYQQAFATAFGSTDISLKKIAQALATYVRTLTPPTSSFDEYLFLDRKGALSEAQQQGLNLFFSERLGCATCHANLTFSGPIRHQGEQAAPVFHITGVNTGTQAFRAPTLRQIRHTAPYMHDGSLPTLASVISHYEQVDVERVPKFSLTQAERDALVSFLEAL